MQLISPRQAARAFGVSESSFKRWCDQGLLATSRTAGGHRKVATAEVLRFAREHNHPLTSPAVLGLPLPSDGARLGLVRGRPRLVQALLDGDESLARQVIFDLYLAGHSLGVIGDEVIAGAFHDIGERWACHEADVYHERRGCEIVLGIVHELRQLQSLRDDAPSAAGATIEGDYYALPSALAELVLRGAGFQASSLGQSIPFASLAKAIEELRPRLFWVSVSYLAEGVDLAGQITSLANLCAANDTALVVGGRAFGDDLRSKLPCVTHCQSMQHLVSFAETLRRALMRPVKRKTHSRQVAESPTKQRKASSRATKPG
jgi:methanogenic corrinoid protein MtbC1